MRAYVVFCHPTHDSLAGAALARALAGLAAGGHEIRLTDLYAEGFQPELSLDDHANQHVDHRSRPELRPDITDYVEHLRWCEALLLVYPTWWSAQPAMLKGFIDRLFVMGVAWELPDGAKRIRPLLRNITKIVAITSHGSTKLVNAVQGEPGKRIVTRSLRVTCNIRCRTRWIAMYNADRSTPSDRIAFLDRVERTMLDL
jgi:putative NADPH-quinone reductase